MAVAAVEPPADCDRAIRPQRSRSAAFAVVPSLRRVCAVEHAACVPVPTDIALALAHDRVMYLTTVQPDLGTDLATGLAAPIAGPRQVHAAWRPMPSVFRPWMCQVLAADSSWTSIELDLVALTPLRLRGAAVEPGTPFTVRALRQRGEAERVEAWARDREMVTALAGRDRRSAWMYLGVGRQRTLLHRVVTTLVARP